MRDQQSIRDQSEKREERPGMAPARGAIFGLALGAFVWLVTAGIIACLRSAV